MRNIKKSFIELLYPKRIKCCVCGRDAGGAVCNTCLGFLEHLEGRVCLKCGKGIDDDYDDNTCPDCKIRDKHFDMAFSCFRYNDMGKTIIHKLKYEGYKEVSYTLARLMYQKLMDEGIRVDAVVPVPIHKNKEESRGFNQAQLIADDIAAAAHIPIWNCITRTKETAEQYKLDKVNRILNIHDAFCINMLYNDVKFENVLLVDDVYTTGSTVDECSKVLKQHGVQRVFVITAATGSNT
jgi:competence protein ComFC